MVLTCFVSRSLAKLLNIFYVMWKLAGSANLLYKNRREGFLPWHEQWHTNLIKTRGQLLADHISYPYTFTFYNQYRWIKNIVLR